jgi:hypothetical protein
MTRLVDPMPVLSKSLLRALCVVSSRAPITGPGFAAQMWPRSTSKPLGLNRSSGRVLGRLSRLGLVERFCQDRTLLWRMTPLGRTALRLNLDKRAAGKEV